MNYRRKAHLAIVLLATAFALVPVAVAGQDQPQVAGIVISLSSTARNGTTIAAASGTATLKVGELGTKYFHADAIGNLSGMSSGQPPGASVGGGSGAGGVSISGGGGVAGGVGGVAGGVVAAPAKRPPVQWDYLWQVDVKPVSIAIDAVTFEMDWKRTELKDGTKQVTAGDHRTITLHQGDRHLLDFVPCPTDSRTANRFLEVQAAPVEDPSVANQTFAYDLWLVHQTADGGKITRHTLITGRQGEKVSFRFAPVPLSIDAAAPADADSPFRLLITGTLVGRQRPDGTIDVALQPKRAQQFPTGGGGLGGGTKTFTSKMDETTSVDLPADQGYSGWRPDPGFTLTTPRPGVTVGADGVRIALRPYFEGSSTSLLVTVHREK